MSNQQEYHSAYTPFNERDCPGISCKGHITGHDETAFNYPGTGNMGRLGLDTNVTPSYLWYPSSAMTPPSTTSYFPAAPVTPVSPYMYQYSPQSVYSGYDNSLGTPPFSNPGQSVGQTGTVDPSYLSQQEYAASEGQRMPAYETTWNTDGHPQMLPTSPSTRQATEPPVATAKFRKQAEERRKKEAKFGCYKCGQTFTTVHNLKHHHVAHTGEKRYQCKDCGRGFTVPHSRNRHMANSCPNRIR